MPKSVVEVEIPEQLEQDAPCLGIINDLLDDRRRVLKPLAKLDGRERRELLSKLRTGAADKERVALVDRDLASTGKGEVGRPPNADWQW